MTIEELSSVLQMQEEILQFSSFTDRKSTRLNSSHNRESRMPSSA